MAKNSRYTACNHIRKEKMVHVADEELTREFSLNYRTYPTFEKGLYEQLCIRHNSLKRNQQLNCRWEQYKKHYEERVTAPKQFPDPRDLHFYKGSIRFEPSQSIFRISDHRMKLKPGPGIDSRGQTPIPQELQMKRGKIATVTDHRQRMKSAKKKVTANKKQ